MWTCRRTAWPHLGNMLTLLNRLTYLHPCFWQMCISCLIAVIMLECYHQAVTLTVIGCACNTLNHTLSGGVNVCTNRCCLVDTSVHLTHFFDWVRPHTVWAGYAIVSLHRVLERYCSLWTCFANRVSLLLGSLNLLVSSFRLFVSSFRLFVSSLIATTLIVGILVRWSSVLRA